MTTSAVPGFLPSTSGFRFANDFAHQPLLRVGVGRVSVPIGDAANGLCGGMVFAARDLFEAGVPAPDDTEAPRRGSPLFGYLVRRLFASFELPLGPLRYLVWMWLPWRDVGPLRGLRRRTMEVHWPAVRAEIDSGHPAPLGLVRARGNPLELGRNHQVLAYAYRDEAGPEGTRLTVRVYDPNHPGDDTVTIVATGGQGLRYVEGEAPVYGFFRTRYRPPSSRRRFPKSSLAMLWFAP